MNRFTQRVGLVTKVAFVSKAVLVAGSITLLGAACWKEVGTNTNVGVGSTNSSVNENVVAGNVNAEVNGNANVNTNNNTNATGEEIDTSDWLTYTNEEYDLSLKYPNYLTLNDYSSSAYFPNDTTQLLRLQLNQKKNQAVQEFHFFIFSSSHQATVEKIKKADQVGSKVQNEGYVEVNSKTYYLITVLTALGSTMDYYLTSLNQSTFVWVVDHEESENLVKDLLQNTSQ